mgnify:CR=1 FL=1
MFHHRLHRRAQLPGLAEDCESERSGLVADDIERRGWTEWLCQMK